MNLPLESIVEAILPLGFVSDFDEAPFGAKGTCFLVRRHGGLWLVSAKHAVGGHLGYLRVPRNADSLEWLELGGSATIDASPEVEDSAFTDLIVIRVLSSGADLAPAIDLDTIAIAKVASPADRVFIAGFPVNGLDNRVDFGESVHIYRQRFKMEAFYEAPDASSQFTHVIRLGLLGDVESLDGMSGSPVFLKHDSLFAFAGVLTMAGGGTLSPARFVHAQVLLMLLDDAWRHELDSAPTEAE